MMTRAIGILSLLAGLAFGLALPDSARAACHTVTAQTWESTVNDYTPDAADAERDVNLSFTATVANLPSGKTIGDVTWEWKHDGTVISTSQSMTYAFNGSYLGPQTVTVKATVDGESASDDCAVNVVDRLIIDTLTSRPDNKISFNNNNRVKGHVHPHSVSHLDANLDWDVDDLPSEHCGLWDDADGNLVYVETYNGNAVWPTTNNWNDESHGLILTLDKRVKSGTSIDERDDLDTAGGLQASVSISFYYEEEGTQNPGAGNPPNWFYYWSQTSAIPTGATISYDSASALGHMDPTPPGYAAYVGTENNEAYTTPSVGANANKTLDGIDHLAWAARHEWQHHLSYVSWWGAGGWSGAVDTDGDQIPDTNGKEAGFGAAQGGPYNTSAIDSHLTDGLSMDGERHTVHAQSVWNVGSANADDWAHPGKQWP